MDLKLLNNPNIKWPYIALEYVEGTGTQHIDTLVKPKKSIGFYVDFQYTATTASQYLFGNVYSSGTSGISYAFYINSNSIFASAYKNGQGDWTATNIAADIDRHTLEFNVNNDNAIKIDGGETYSATLTNTPSNTENGSIILFGSRNRTSGSIASHSKVKIYEAKIYDNGVLIKDMIPVINVADNSVGLLDNIGKEFYPNQGTGNFIGDSIKSTDVCNYITSLYIKDCPNIQSINILRNSINTNRVRINIGTQYLTVAELYKYSFLLGFNDAYENQTKPRLVGTCTISDYWTNDEMEHFQSSFDGLVVNYDLNKNVDILLDNDDLAIQTLDNTKPNYNPAAAIVLYNEGYGNITQIPLIEGGGRFFITKDEVASITTLPETIFNDITTVIDEDSIVTDDNTASYNFETFDEFELFTGLSGTLSNGFRNTILTSIKCPQNKSINLQAFQGNTSISNLHIHGSSNLVSHLSFKYDGTLIVDGNASGAVSNSGSYSIGRFLYYIIKGNITSSGNQQSLLKNNTNAKSIRIGGNASFGSSNATYTICPGSSTYALKFFEVMGTWSGATRASSLFYGTVSNLILHFGNSNIATTANLSVFMGKTTMLYVGNGSSRDNDEDTLQLYLDNTTWATYSTKLATWYDYNGIYKWYYVTDNLTNCTNTNPDEWPHITRGEEYRTTIVANEGYTLGTVKVEMYFARDNAPTPDEPTDITESAYNPSTGEIYIENVFGNIVITASAS